MIKNKIALLGLPCRNRSAAMTTAVTQHCDHAKLSKTQNKQKNFIISTKSMSVKKVTFSLTNAPLTSKMLQNEQNGCD